MKCVHESFDALVAVNRLEDSGRFMADISIVCRDCGVSMVFLGLPRGVDLNGAATSPFGTELRAAVHPRGEAIPELDLGFYQRSPTA